MLLRIENGEGQMITYKASFKFLKKTVLAQVIDFPGVLTEGKDLDDAREMLADALITMAESHMADGSPFPIPNPNATDLDADLEEPIYFTANL